MKLGRVTTMSNVFCNVFPCDLTTPPTPSPNSDSDCDCIYGEAYPDVYPDAHPCDTVISATTEIPCDLEPKTLYASCGQTKTHRIVPTNEDGIAIDTQGVDLTFVIENQEEFDLETGCLLYTSPSPRDRG